ncbi:MAG: hypothetical protein HY744_13945 [Deltaproteobacteria bacterium]|nr:hypothetical protein [Deltaproteobacteria bacterium]
MATMLSTKQFWGALVIAAGALCVARPALAGDEDEGSGGGDEGSSSSSSSSSTSTSSSSSGAPKSPDCGKGGSSSSGGAEDPGQKTNKTELSEVQTSYTGAIMLRGEQEVTFDSVVPGTVGDESYQADGRYAYFSGNTLYAGVQDDVGNFVDIIAEFFWFESSLKRGSDFYVAVLKARTSPNLKEWVLERKNDGFTGKFVADQESTLYVKAQTALTGDGAFRWDWSIPFDNYGWDKYGNITMETKYGVDVCAEGAAQKAISGEPGGVPVEANVQAKGYFNWNYAVQTKYEVTLWRWEVIVHGSAGDIQWQMNLHSPDREKQNAYHEFFLVMQADQGKPFHLDWLEVGGAVKKPIPFWWDEHRALSAAVTGITLYPPQLPPPPPSDNGTGGSAGVPDPDDYPGEPVDNADGSDDDRPSAPWRSHPEELGYGCALGAGAGSGGWALVLGLGLLVGLRRRRG